MQDCEFQGEARVTVMYLRLLANFYLEENLSKEKKMFCILSEKGSTIRVKINSFLSDKAPVSERPSLRKHAYSNILRILPPKNENFQMKNSGSFHISAQNIDCGYLLEPPRRGGSNEYP